MASSKQRASGDTYFFSSGLRAIVGRARGRILSTRSTSALRQSTLPFSDEALATPEKSSRKRPSHRRALSMINPSHPPPLEASSSALPTPKNPRRRSSSVIAPRFREVVSPSEETSFFEKTNITQWRLNRNSSLLDIPSQSKPWDDHKPAALSRAPSNRLRVVVDDGPSMEDIDPFAASRDSKSFFIDLSRKGSASPTGNCSRRSKRTSFLSLTSSDKSFFPFFTSRSSTSFKSSPRRQSNRPRKMGSNRSSFILEEEEVGPRPSSTFTEEYEFHDLATIDWRQFHIDVLIDT